jgi:hypothetical protein
MSDLQQQQQYPHELQVYTYAKVQTSRGREEVVQTAENRQFNNENSSAPEKEDLYFDKYFGGQNRKRQ